MSDLFYVRNRLKALRTLMSKAGDLSHGSALHDAIIDFLEDLTSDLAERYSNDSDNAYYFIVRCMGAIAEANAEEAYEPFGHGNPFSFTVPPPPVPPSSPTFARAFPPRPVWNWPVINQPPSGGSGGFTGTFRDFSALKLFGYTVGKKGRDEGWSDHRRRAFLSDFMELSLPAIVKKTFGEEYGEPMSTTRLHKVANLIAALANNTARKSNAGSYEQAITDWEADLAFLKATYYEGKGLKFHPWPEVER